MTKPTGKRKRYISYEDLPAGTKVLFKKKVIPLALETTGALKPWQVPDDKAIIDIWNLVYDEDMHIDESDTDCEMFLVAKTLVRDIVMYKLTFLTIFRCQDQTRNIKLAAQICRDVGTCTPC